MEALDDSVMLREDDPTCTCGCSCSCTCDSGWVRAMKLSGVASVGASANGVVNSAALMQ